MGAVIQVLKTVKPGKISFRNLIKINGLILLELTDKNSENKAGKQYDINWSFRRIYFFVFLGNLHNLLTMILCWKRQEAFFLQNLEIF